MKYLSYGLALGVMTLLISFICVTVMGRDIRGNETDQGLSEAVDSTLQGMYDEGRFYTVDNRDDFAAGFLERLSLQMESDSDVELDIVSADDEKGVLSVRIREHYKHPNGADGTAECYKTIFKDSAETEDTKTVNYYFYASREELEAEESPLFEGEGPSGTAVYQPDAPEQESGAAFKGFADASGAFFTDGAALYTKEGETVTKYEFYAVYE